MSIPNIPKLTVKLQNFQVQLTWVHTKIGNIPPSEGTDLDLPTITHCQSLQ